MLQHYEVVNRSNYFIVAHTFCFFTIGQDIYYVEEIISIYKY